MRPIKAIWFIMVALTIGVIIAGLPLNSVQAIREVTPTPEPDAPAEPALPTSTPSTSESEGSLDEQLNNAYELFGAGDYQEAIDAATAIIDQFPDAAEAYLLRGISYSQISNVNRAIDDFTEAIRILPYNWTAYTFRAAAYAQSNQFAKALSDYDKAIELNPRFAAAYTDRALLLEESGDSENAEIDRLIAEGITRLGRGDFPGAISRFTQAIDVNDTPERHVSNAYYNRALAHYNLRDIDAAIEDYTAAIELDSEMHDAYLGRGIAYREIEEMEQAGADFARRIEILAENTVEDTLELGENVEVEMSYGQVYQFTFEGQEGQRLTLTARDLTLVGVDPLIALLDPEGTPIAGDDDAGGELDSEIANFELPADGTYTLLVSHANGGYDGLITVLVEE